MKKPLDMFDHDHEWAALTRFVTDAQPSATLGVVWQASRRRFMANVLGPHFQQVCREWALHHADPDRLGGLPSHVGQGVVSDPSARTSHEVDVAVVGVADGARAPLLAIGEAKWNDTMGIAHIDRLRHIRDVITRTSRYDTSRTRLLCFSGAGFNTKAHHAAATSPDVHLIDLQTLYDTTGT
ncbi:hypothetical protein HFP71_20255 [Streptomyces sp. ARC32]